MDCWFNWKQRAAACNNFCCCICNFSIEFLLHPLYTSRSLLVTTSTCACCGHLRGNPYVKTSCPWPCVFCHGFFHRLTVLFPTSLCGILFLLAIRRLLPPLPPAVLPHPPHITSYQLVSITRYLLLSLPLSTSVYQLVSRTCYQLLSINFFLPTSFYDLRPWCLGGINQLLSFTLLSTNLSPLPASLYQLVSITFICTNFSLSHSSLSTWRSTW